MTREEFNDLTLRLKRGDNSALGYLQSYQEKCVRSLLARSSGKCDPEMAYDIFIDSVLDFRKNVLLDRVAFQNIPAYISRICWNKWLETYRQRNRQTEMHKVYETHQKAAQAHPDDRASAESFRAERLAKIEAGMAHLSEQCRKVLNMAIADGMPMAEIADQLGMASADVAKTTKSRCFKRLLTFIRENA